MDRPVRAFQPAALPLEGRLMLSPVPVTAVPPNSEWVTFSSGPSPTSPSITQEYVPQGGEATVWLRGYSTSPVTLQVSTDPSSPAVGVNLPAINQTVTLTPGQTISAPATVHQTVTSAPGQNISAPVTIPTYPGAPNAGEVDVNLTITPIDPPPGFSAPAPLELRIIAPDGNTPPRITGVTGTPNGIELQFSKPMNPTQASNVHNYTVRATVNSSVEKDPALVSVFGFLSPDSALGGYRNSRSTLSVPLRSANYDPADFTVTLVPKRRMTSAMENSIVVTPGSAAQTSAHLRHESSPAQALTDLEGNPINQGGKPGEFRIDVRSGYTPLA